MLPKEDIIRPSVSEMCKERWEYQGEQSYQILGDSGEPTSLCVMMTIQKVLQKPGDKPLSFFGGKRIWALRKIAIFCRLGVALATPFSQASK